MAGWNDVSFTDVDIQTDSAFHQMFVDAWQERRDAAQDGGSGLAGTPFAINTSGDDVQTASATSAHSCNNIIALQTLPVETYPDWGPPDIDPTSFTADAIGTIDPGYGNADPVDRNKARYASIGDLFSAAGLDPAHGYERRRPREINSATATVDLQGNSASAGQFAYYIDPIFPIPPGSKGLYRCVASGNWVRDFTAGAKPDVLSNYSSAPNAVADYVDFMGIATGRAQSGDYIGSWLWEDVRDVYNQMTLTVPGDIAGGGSPIAFAFDSMGESVDGNGNDVTYGGAVALAAADWAGATPSFFDAWPMAFCIATCDSFASSFSVEYFRRKSHLTCYERVGAPPCNRQIKFYLAVQEFGEGATFDAASVFDANGDGVLYKQYILVDTVTDGVNPSVNTVAFAGSIGTQPNTAADPSPLADPTVPAHGGTQYRGWKVLCTIALVRWDVSGGFVYHA